MLSDKQHQALIQQAETLAKQSTIKLLSPNIDLIWRETAFESVGEMVYVAQYLCQTCGRVVVFTTQDEFTHLVVARSSNIPYIDANTIIQTVSRIYRGDADGNEFMAFASYYQYEIVPEIVDKAVELIITAIP